MQQIGRYEVIGRIGAGGFATVYRVRDTGLESEVAAKVLAENWTDTAELRDRFILEARLLRRIDSRRVVTVHDIGELPSGQPYFVMSLADRGTLEDRLVGAPALAADDLRALAGELAECVRAVHAHDLIHRDIKPSNLLITASRSTGPAGTGSGLIVPPERLLLGDFGLAKDVALQASGMTAGLTIAAGTGGYAAPEQMNPAGKPDRRTDLYAAAGVMYRVISGQVPPPFDVVRQTVPFPDHEPWMAGELGSFFRQAMSFSQDGRPPSIDAWHQHLLFALANGQGSDATVAAPLVPNPGAIDPGTLSGRGPTVPTVGSNQQPVVADEAAGPRAHPVSLPVVDPSSLTRPSPPSTGQQQPSPPSVPATSWRSPPPPSPQPHSLPHEAHNSGSLPPVSGHQQASFRPEPNPVLPPNRARRWPWLFVVLIVLGAAGGAGWFYLSGTAPTVDGDLEVVAGQTPVFSAALPGADSYEWTDWDGLTSTGGEFSFNAIVPGPVSFSVVGITDGSRSRSKKITVDITPAPNGPRILGPENPEVGEEAVYEYDPADGTDPEWRDEQRRPSDPAANWQGPEYKLKPDGPGTWEIILIVTQGEGTPDEVRVGTRREVVIVDG